MELPSKRFLTINLPSEEGGDMITMEDFTSLVRSKLSGNLILSHLMVGSRYINDRAVTRPLHSFLLDGRPWFAYTVDATKHQGTKNLLVIALAGRFMISIPATAYVWEIKKLIEDHEGPLSPLIKLMYDGMELEDSVSTFFIPNGATLHIVLHMCGGGCLGVPFTDVTDEDGPEEQEWSEEAPDWRAASCGLCLEGECTNKTCEAYGHMVITGQGYTDFDLINDAYLCKCPICHHHVVPITCGFNNCQWKIIARKVDLGNPPQMFKTEWKEVGNLYERFSPEKSGTACFFDLKILCRKSLKRESCKACSLIAFKMKKASCGHSFHADHCFDLADANNNCIECLAHRNLTDYQKLFVELLDFTTSDETMCVF